jgi:hypothetical protein
MTRSEFSLSDQRQMELATDVEQDWQAWRQKICLGIGYRSPVRLTNYTKKTRMIELNEFNP